MNKETIPEVSITIPFKGRNLGYLVACIKSFLEQSYPAKEIIIVGNENDLKDLGNNFSSKELKKIEVIYSKAEKNEARNVGIKASKGSHVFIIDHDMEAKKNLIESCIKLLSKYEALFVPERGVGGNFWENCSKLQKKLIQYDLDTISPRFFKRNIFSNKESPFDQSFGELDEWGFNLNLQKKKVKIGMVRSSHLLVKDDNLTLFKEIRLKFTRGLWMGNFYKTNKNEAWRRINPIKRGLIFYGKRIDYFIKEPIYFIGVLFFKGVSLLAFAAGCLVGCVIKKDKKLPKEQVRYLYDEISSKYLLDMYEGTNWNKYVDWKEKHVVAKIWKLKKDKKFQSQKLLDLGVGPGRWSEFFLKFNFKKVVGLDISPKMVKLARSRIKNKNFTSMIGDIEDTGLKKGSFDKVFCFRSFKYLPNPKRAWSEILRVTRPKGEIILEVTNNNLQNILLKPLSFLILFVNPRISKESRWRYFNRAKFYSLNSINKIIASEEGGSVLYSTPLFILPSIKLFQSVDSLVFKKLIKLDNLLIKILPVFFVRSWVLKIVKK